MKTTYRLLTILILLVLALPGRAAAEKPALAPSDGPTARFGHTMTNVNGTVYLFGGLTPGNPNPQNDLLEYSSLTNDWTQVFAAGPAGRHSHTATAVNGKLYVYGGMNAMNQPQVDTWSYSPTAHTWDQVLAAGPGGRAYHSAVAVGDQVVVVGGIVSGGSPSSETWVFDTVTHSWEQGQDFPDLGYADSMAAYNGKAYVIGHSQSQLYVYDLAADTWTTVAATGPNGAPAPRVLALSAQDGATAWLGGGEDIMTADIVADVWSLDLATATWTPCDNLPEPLCHSAMAVVGGGSVLSVQGAAQPQAATPARLLIFGGMNSQGQVSGNQYIYLPHTWRIYLPLVLRQ